MGQYIGPTFESFNQGLETYGFETQDIDIVFTINSSSFSVITSGTCTYNVYWGDGTNETVNASGTFTKSHSYSSSGIYNVSIDVVSGTFRPYYNNDSEGDKITRIRGKYNSIFDGSFQNAFYGSANLEEFTVDLSGVTSLYIAFLSCPNLDYFNNNASSIALQRPLFNFRDLSNVTYIGGAFADTGSLVFNGFNLSGLSGSQYYQSGTSGSLTFYGPFSRTLYNNGYYSGSTEESNVVSIGSSTEPIGFGTTGGNTFGLQFFASGCTSLNQVYFDSGVKITSLQYAFTGATGLDTFEVLDKDLSNCTAIGGAFANTGSLVFNGFNLSGLSGGQYYQKSYSSSLSYYGPFSRILLYNGYYSGSTEVSNVVSIGSSTEPIGFGTTGGNTFSLQFFASGCTSLNQVYFDSGVKITSLQYAFTRSTALDTFEVLDKDLSNCTAIGGAFADTGSLVFNGFNLSGLSGNQYYQSGISNSLTYYGPFSRTLYYNNYYSGSTEASNVVSIGSSTNPIGFGTTGGNTFNLSFFASGCTSLQQVYFDSGVKITSLQYAFTRSTALDTFEVLDKDLSNCSNIGGAFANTGSLVFNGFNLSGLSGNQYYQSGISGSLAFYGPFSRAYTPNSIDNYSSSSDTSNVVSIGSSTEPIGFGTTGGNTFSLDVFASGCTSLNQVYFDSGVKITSLRHAFRNCSGLTTFRNQDSATGFTTITNMSNAFTGCALDADSIENILVSCDNGGKSSVVLNINGGSNAAYSTWSGIATQALSNLQGKSWTISYNT